jgi:pimeloyl-ACP methyl ester carboxylesterase
MAQGDVTPTIKTKDGTEIYYKDWGSGQPVVFSHGWPLSSDAWETQMFFLASHGYRCIGHDRRGHGAVQPRNALDQRHRAAHREVGGLVADLLRERGEALDVDEHHGRPFDRRAALDLAVRLHRTRRVPVRREKGVPSSGVRAARR